MGNKSNRCAFQRLCLHRMKTLLLICTIALSASAQNVAIRLLIADPDHEFNAVAGCPTNWPIVVNRIGTNAVAPFPRMLVRTEEQLANLYESVGPAFTNWHQTVWANYRATNGAAVSSRRLQLLAEREGIVSRLQSLSNATDFTTLTAPLITSNLVRLRLIEQRLDNGP